MVATQNAGRLTHFSRYVPISPRRKVFEALAASYLKT